MITGDGMYSYRELRKAARQPVQEIQLKAAVLGNCSTQLFSSVLQGYANLEGLGLSVLDTDYNGIEFQLRDEGSEVYRYQPELMILWIASEKLYEDYLDADYNRREQFAEETMDVVRGYWSLIRKHSNARILQMNFTEINDKALGNYSAKVDKSFIYQLRKLNYLLEEAMHAEQDVYPVDLLSVQVQLGQNEFFHAPMYYSAKLSVSVNALPYVAKAVTDVMKALRGTIKKCVILDLDNTLWGGIIGEDGIDHIEIGELGRGHVFTNLQRWLKQLKEFGILLAVCSKNDEELAKEPFEQLDEMILKLSDISVFVANWEDKASNIRLIQKTLNIAMDSFVFLDDNPAEREIVRRLLPEVAVPELPEDPALYLEYLQSCNYFESASFDIGARDRTAQYQAEYERNKLQAEYLSIDDYLDSLEMKGRICAFDKEHAARIAQLTQRSNQFNLRTVRYTEGEIDQIADSPDHIPLYFMLKDRFGDYGLVGIMIVKRRSDRTAFVDTWLMSCRVLKRGMEEYMMNGMVSKLLALGYTTIESEYIPTSKNSMVRDIYKQMGFEEYEPCHYRLNIEEYQVKKTYIRDDRL